MRFVDRRYFEPGEFSCKTEQKKKDSLVSQSASRPFCPSVRKDSQAFRGTPIFRVGFFKLREFLFFRSKACLESNRESTALSRSGESEDDRRAHLKSNRASTALARSGKNENETE